MHDVGDGYVCLGSQMATSPSVYRLKLDCYHLCRRSKTIRDSITQQLELIQLSDRLVGILRNPRIAEHGSRPKGAL